MDFKTMTIDDIILWCQQNDKVAWLKAKASEKTEYKVYPRVKGEDGKYKVDKTQAPTVKTRPISFIQIKLDFAHEFMPEILPEKKEKKETMFDKIMAL